MARYSTFLYGDEKYGTSPTTDNFLWTFMVDWTNDKTWNDGYNDGRFMVDLKVVRGRNSMLKHDGSGWERYQPGRLTVTLDNSDGRYDPYNTSSPIYPYVTPGKHFQLKVKNGNTGGNYNMMWGIITDIQPYTKGKQKYVKIEGTDAIGWMLGKQIEVYGLHTSIDWTNIDFGIRTNVGFPSDRWTISTVDTGNYTMLYSWFSEIAALEAIQQAADAEMGGFVHDRFGSWLRWSGDSTQLGTVTIDESELLNDIVFPQPWEVVRNDIRVKCYPKQSFSVGAPVIWDLGEQPSVAGGGGYLETLARFRYNNRTVCATGAIFTATFNSNQDGSGTNYTCTTTYGEIGDAVRVRFTNNDPFAKYLIGAVSTDEPAKITSNVIYTPYERTQIAQDTTSIGLYGPRTLTIDSSLIQDVDYAQAYADHLLAQFKDPKKQPVVKIENRPTLQFARDIWRDKITLNAPSVGISGEYFRIGKVQHEWLRENGQAVRTTWNLEPFLDPFTV